MSGFALLAAVGILALVLVVGLVWTGADFATFLVELGS